ncbi:hypothetical protein D3C77_585150 [compost metagenome]
MRPVRSREVSRIRNSTIIATKQPIIWPMALSINEETWKLIGLLNTMMLIVLARVPSDPKRRFCTSIPMTKDMIPRLRHSKNMLC